ncbi:MAG TPA: cupin domain-containing protein [Chloroflexota bacterium]|nr:cupin domain-containing protein [Chloroflexota bacterium]
MDTATLRHSSQAYVLLPDEGETIAALGLRILATDRDTGGALTAGICTNPGPGGPPLHSHAAVDELYYVLAGRYRFKIRGDEIEGGPGTFACVPRGISHTFASVGPGEGKLLAITLPGTENFLREMAHLQEQGTDQRKMVDHFRRHEASLDGPPLV